MAYDLELDRAVAQVKETKAKMVCIQLPEGLKPEAPSIIKKIEKETGANVILWMGSCYGACDLPDVDKLGVDLLIQWGHSEWS